MEEKQKISGRYLMVILAMCGFAGSAVGMVINSSGVFFTPIAEEFGIGRAAVAMTLTISTIAAAVSALFVPKLMKPKTMKPLFLCGTLMMVIGTALLSTAGSIGFMYAMNVIRGLGSGLIHFVTVAMLINNWFYARNGLMTSIAMCFSGLVGAVMSPVMTAVMNASGWRTAYLVMAAVMTVFCLPALLLPITLTPQESGLKPYGYAGDDTKTAAGTETSRPVKVGGTAMALAIVVAIAANTVIAMSQHLPSYAEVLGYSSTAGSLLVSICLVGNITSKLVTGTLTDAIGARNTILLMTGLDALAYVLLLADLGTVMMYGGALLFGCGFGIAAVGVTMMCRALFGNEGFAKSYPIVSFIGTVTNALASTLVGSMYDATGSYTSVMIMCLILTAVLAVSDVLAFRRKA